MKRLGIILFIITLSAHTAVKLGLELWFLVNQAEIIAEHCENKAKPELKCNGKCYLAKQIESIDNLENKNDQEKPSQQIKISFEWIQKDYFTKITPVYVPKKTDLFVHDDIDYSYLFFTEIYHPPQV